MVAMPPRRAHTHVVPRRTRPIYLLLRALLACLALAIVVAPSTGSTVWREAVALTAGPPHGGSREQVHAPALGVRARSHGFAIRDVVRNVKPQRVSSRYVAPSLVCDYPVLNCALLC